MTVLDQVLHHKIVAILRGIPSQEIMSIAEALYAGGIRIMEITLNSDSALPVISQLRQSFNNRMLIGAGTVISTADARNAIAAGAQFLISPMLDTAVIKVSKDAGVVSIPGAFTPTEIVQAYSSGADVVKIFPCLNAVYVKNILAPLDYIPVMPTGGIDVSNIKTFADTGAVAFGIGSALVNNKSKIDDSYLTALTSNARQFVAAVNS